MADSPDPIPVGSEVQLNGLTGASHLNGAVGKVTGPPSSADPPRYPIRLLSPSSAVAAHPEGVRVRAANLTVTEMKFKLTDIQRVKSPGVPLTPENAGTAVASFVEALEADRFPQKGLDGLFGVQMPAAGRDGSNSVAVRRCRIGQLTLGAWQELLRAHQAKRLGAAVRSYGGTQQELDFALMSASIGGLDALRAMGGPRGPQLADVAEAGRKEFTAEVEGALRGGSLPQWFEGAVQCTAATPGGAPDGAPGGAPNGGSYCSELCRRGFERVPWDLEMLEEMRAAG